MAVVTLAEGGWDVPEAVAPSLGAADILRQYNQGNVQYQQLIEAAPTVIALRDEAYAQRAEEAAEQALALADTQGGVAMGMSPIDLIFGAAGGALEGLGLSAKKKASGGGGRRRRKARLTHSDLIELTNVKSILGKTAAANALPFYLGRR